MIRHGTRWLSALVVAIGIAIPLTAQAATRDLVTIGYIGGTTSIDPHFHTLAANASISRAVFDGIVNADTKMNPVPGIAEKWTRVDPNTWEFTIRSGVAFHDGTPVTSQDVAFSFERALNIKDSPSGGFSKQLKGKTVKVVDDRVFRIVTADPAPGMLVDLSTFAIVSRKHATGATREDFNSGKAAVGSGPYKFVEWVPGNRVVLERNEQYWGQKPDFKRVVMRPIESGPTRVAALVSGDVDAIEQPPSTDIARLQAMGDIHIAKAPSKRIIYIHMDNFRDDTPDVLGNDGQKIKSPLRDKRVRWALSLGIDRNAIIEHVMEGGAEPAGQYAPEGVEGHNPVLKPIPHDPARAKALLAQAGYPDGFRLKFHSTGKRYPNDVEVAEAIGQMWSSIGVKTEVVTYPASVFFRRGTSGGPGKTPEFSVLMAGCCSSTGGAIAPLVTLMATPDRPRGRGTANRGRYSNPELDVLIEKALTEMDDAKREQATQQAQAVAVGDMAVIPVHFIINAWATRGNVRWEPTLDDTSIPTRAKFVN